MRIVGLTGQIGTGKSTVSRWLEAYGVVAIDSDALVRQLYDGDAALHAQLQGRFGGQVVRSGSVDKAALGAAVFSDTQALTDLEAIVHPVVRRLRDQQVEEARRRGVPACAVEAIKLVESGGSDICDELWIVVAGERVQLERLAGRGMAEADARRRLAAQGTVASWSEQFLAESTRLDCTRPIVIFDNSGAEEVGKAHVKRLWEGVCAAP